nr:DNA polymerase III subunit delta [Caldalkalibacillus mannanilyticus]
MHISEAIKKIKKGQIAPVYVFYGTQKFLMDEAVQEISKQILDEETIDFNYETFDLQEQFLDEAVEAAQTFPFLGEKRLIVATDALFLTGSKGNKLEHNLETLEAYVDSPADFSVLVLMVQQEKLDERKKIVKLLKQKGQLCSCSPLQQNELVSWVSDTAKQQQVSIEETAGAMLVQYIGNHMQLLSKEIEKMAQYVGRGNRIDLTVVNELVSKNIEQDVFSLVDHVVHYRTAEAFDTLHELLKRNEEPIKILALLARQFRLIFKARNWIGVAIRSSKWRKY